MKYYLLPIVLIFTWALSSCSDSNDALELELKDRISSQRLLNQIHLATIRFKSTEGKLPGSIDDLLKNKDVTFKDWYEFDFNRLTKNGHTITFSYSPLNLNTDNVLSSVSVNGALAFELSGNGNFIE